MTFWGRKLLFGDVNYFLRAYIRKEVRIFGGSTHDARIFRGESTNTKFSLA